MMRFRGKGILLLALVALMVILAGGACAENSMFEGHDADTDMWTDGELNVSQVGMGISLQPESKILREDQDISAGIIFRGDTEMPEIYTGYDVYVGKDLYFSKEGENLSGTVPYAVWSDCCKPGDVKMPIYIVAHTTKGSAYWKETFYLNVGITECDEHDWTFEVLEGRGKVYSPSNAVPTMHYLAGAFGRVYCRKCGMTQQTCYKGFSEEDTPESPEPHQYEGDRCAVCGSEMNDNSLEGPIIAQVVFSEAMTNILEKVSFQGNNKGRIRASDETRLAKNFTEKMLEAGIYPYIIIDCLAKLETTEDEEMKEAWLAMFADPELLDIRTSILGTSFQAQDRDGQMYIQLNSALLDASTVFHEVGHAVDNMAGRLTDPDSRYYMYYTSRTEPKYNEIRQDTYDNLEAHAKKIVEKHIATMKSKPEKYRNDNAISEVERNKDAIVEYVSERIFGYSLPLDDQFKYISNESFEKDLCRRYFDSEEIPETITQAIDFHQIEADILWDYRTVDDRLLEGIQGLDNIDWKKTYKTMISDVYGGVTNNQIADGYCHGTWTPVLPTELEKPNDMSFDKKGRMNYWYTGKSNTTVEVGDSINYNVDKLTSEPWAEYTECKLQNYEGTDKVAGAFLHSVNFPELKTHIHEVMMDYLDEHGITDYGEGK